MPRIVYLLLSEAGMAGGHKMILRRVETLRTAYICFAEAILASKQQNSHMWLWQNRSDFWMLRLFDRFPRWIAT